MNPLSIELNTYETKLPTLIGQQGKFVLIKGEEIAGIYDSYEDALKIGYQKFKLDPFLVKQISVTGQVLSFTRELGTACPA